MRIFASLAIALLAASTACAHVGYKIKMTASYKETKKGDASFRNVFVSGHAHYPNGTSLLVMIRPDKGPYLPMNIRVTVEKEEFAAEMGPWREGFPAGKYVCEAWFEFDRQTEGVKSLLREEEEFQKCLKDDPEYQEKYKKENPERYEKLMRQIAGSGRCASSKQFGTCELTIGTADDAAQSGEAEKAFLGDRADLVKDMLTELVKNYLKHSDPNKGADATAESYAAWAAEFQAQIGLVDAEISGRLREMVFNARKGAYDTLVNSIMALGDLERIMQAGLYGEPAKKLAELKAINDKGDSTLDKDQKRRRDALKRELAGAVEDRSACERRLVESLAETRFGNKGLEPAPARKKKYVEELQAEYGFQW
ncbi:MAG: hypothetical protein FD180_3490 [Planctomycetota bacterium]|nr:MAG: hypothetical protein FD180_3490 [Planctomycetota bacterium]